MTLRHVGGGDCILYNYREFNTRYQESVMYEKRNDFSPAKTMHDNAFRHVCALVLTART